MNADVTLPPEDAPPAPPPALDPPPATPAEPTAPSAATTRAPARVSGSPFAKAKAEAGRLKLLVWADFGVGKTWFALQFPGVSAIDMERGTVHYGDQLTFEVQHTASPDDVMATVDWLLTNEHPYRTLVIDPITIYWEALQRKWSDIYLRRNRGKKGHRHEFYAFQPNDWAPMKAELKELCRKLAMLDMNVICTAREKPKYAEGDGEIMRRAGETFDAEKSLPYLFDTVMRMWVGENGQRMAEVSKDRSQKLPLLEPFVCDYPAFEELIGRDVLEREAKPLEMASDAQRARIRHCITVLELPADAVEDRLAHYDATCIDDLTAEHAATILSKLEPAVAQLEGDPNDHTNEE